MIQMTHTISRLILAGFESAANIIDAKAHANTCFSSEKVLRTKGVHNNINKLPEVESAESLNATKKATQQIKVTAYNT